MRSLPLATLVIFGLFWLNDIAAAQELIADLERQRGSEVFQKLEAARSELAEDIKQGDMRRIRLEMAAGLDPFKHENSRLFEAAICANQLAIAQFMVQAAKEGDSRYIGPRIWDCVAEHQSAALARTLLKVGPRSEWTVEQAKLAIDAGAISLFQSSGSQAVAAAVSLNNPRLARALLLEGPHPQGLIEFLLKSAIQSNEPELFKSYLALDTDRTLISRHDRHDLLTSAIKNGDPLLVESLLQLGVEITPEILELATQLNRGDLLVLMAGSKGIDPWQILSYLLLEEPQDLWRQVAHHVIYVPQGRSIDDMSPQELARELLSGGIDPARASRVHPDQLDLEATDRKGRTGLIAAASKGQLPLVVLYLQAGAQVDAQDQEGKSALMIAAAGRNVPMISLLRKAGASSEIADKTDRRAADLFWSSKPLNPYLTEDGARSITFELPEGFRGRCRAPEGRGLVCASQENFETELIVRQVQTPKRSSPSSDSSNEPKITTEQENDQAVFVASGKKRDYEVIVKARGPLGLSPEVRWLSRSQWQSVVPPPPDDVILKAQLWALFNNLYVRLLIGSIAISVLTFLFVAMKKSSSRA